MGKYLDEFKPKTATRPSRRVVDGGDWPTRVMVIDIRGKFPGFEGVLNMMESFREEIDIYYADLDRRGIPRLLNG